jgi:hypothetical protein
LVEFQNAALIGVKNPPGAILQANLPFGGPILAKPPEAAQIELARPRLVSRHAAGWLASSPTPLQKISA